MTRKKKSPTVSLVRSSAAEYLTFVAASGTGGVIWERKRYFVLGLVKICLLVEHPVITIAKVVELLSTTKPTANKAVQGLLQTGVLRETTGKKRDRAYGYTGYLDLLKVGTEL